MGAEEEKELNKDSSDESRQQSEADFVQLLTGAQRPLRAYTITLLGGRSQDADDVLQDVNTTIWLKRQQYDSDKPFLPWAFAFAYHGVLAWRRDTARGKIVIFNDELVSKMHSYFEKSLATAPQADDYLRQCLLELSTSEHDLVNQRYRENASVKAMSAKQKKSPGSIAKRLFRIREKLRMCIRSKIAEGSHIG